MRSNHKQENFGQILFIIIIICFIKASSSSKFHRINLTKGVYYDYCSENS